MKARQLNYRLCDLDFGAIHLFIEGRERQSAMSHDFATLGDCFKNTLAKPAPGVDVEPERLVFVLVRRKLLNGYREFYDFVAGIIK